ncbi:DUF4419 domain-containing protein [Trichocoleus sp. FACHB-591]|nr:DUF4419 domain-containing protein [Trichocoleus sp. FACHB-591]
MEDWERIYERVQTLGQYELEWWTQRLLPICEEFIQAVSGNPNLEFWRSIYKPQRTYGTERITGWLTDLFPYIEASWVQSQPRLVRNPILAIERSQLSIDDGLASRLLPLGQSRVGIKLITEGSEQTLELIAGFIGVNQHPKWQVLKPVVGWAVLKRDPIT